MNDIVEIQALHHRKSSPSLTAIERIERIDVKILSAQDEEFTFDFTGKNRKALVAAVRSIRGIRFLDHTCHEELGTTRKQLEKAQIGLVLSKTVRYHNGTVVIESVDGTTIVKKNDRIVTKIPTFKSSWNNIKKWKKDGSWKHSGVVLRT